MPRKRKPRSVVFLTEAERAAAARKKRQRAARARSQALGFGPQSPLFGPRREPARSPMKPKTDRFGIVTSPVPGKFGGVPIGAGGTAPRAPKPKQKVAPPKPPRAPLRIPKGTSTQDTVPPDRKASTPSKPRSIAEQTVTEKSRKQAKRTRQPSRQPGAARKRAAQTVLPGPAPAGFPVLPTARQLAAAEFAPTFTGYDVEAKADAAAAAERQRAVQGFTLALMKELGGLAPGVAADYSAAATATQGVAESATAQLRGEGTDANARLQADLAAIGAPAEAVAQSAQMTGDVFGGGAAAQYFTEGAMPTQALIGEGARQTAFTRQLPAFSALSGQQNMRQALYEAEQERQELGGRRAATIREMGARVPAYQLQLATEKTRRQEAAADLATKQQAAAANEDYLRFQMGLKTRAQTLAEAKAVDQSAQGRARIAQADARLKLSSIQADRSWNATLRRLGQGDSRLKLDYAKAEADYQRRGKAGGASPGEVQRWSSEAADRAADFYNGVQDADGNVIQPPLATVQSGYQEAMRDLLSRGIPLTLAQRALNRWWRTPGKYGRPKVPFQLRTKKGAK